MSRNNSQHNGNRSHGWSITVLGAIGANIAIAVAKIAAGLATGSSAMLAEAVHSFVDTGNQALLLLGEHRSRKPPDAFHPFGYGKELYFWGMIVAMVLFGIGGGLSVYEGVHQIRAPVALSNPFWNFAVLGFAILAEGTSFTIAIYALWKQKLPSEGFIAAFRNSKDPRIFFVIGEDSAAMVGLVVAAIGVSLSHLFDAAWIDGVAAIIIGLILFAVALVLILETRALVLGERADQSVVRSAENAVAAEKAVTASGPVFTMQMGPEAILMAFEVRLEEGASLRDGLDAIERIRDDLQARIGKLRNLTIGLRESAPHRHPGSNHARDYDQHTARQGEGFADYR